MLLNQPLYAPHSDTQVFANCLGQVLKNKSKATVHELFPGTYDPDSSSSFNALSDGFTIQYGDNSWARGYYAVDTLSIENAKVPEAQFGVATDSSIDSTPPNR